MKATGIVRRIDDLGRVVIPKEIRRTMRIREGDPLEIFTDREGEVILKKYSPISELNEFAGEYADSVASILGGVTVITDTDQVVAVSGGSKKEFMEKRISRELEKLIQEKGTHLAEETGSICPVTTDDSISSGFDGQIIVPIVSQGDSIGAVIIFAKGNSLSLKDAGLKTAEVGASFLAKQMES